ncbi:MAG: TonB-dependent receptor [Pseudomonadota bacterium]|nr:TonB-dependent receptor [Pseudomonadota bacterium]
MNRNIFRKSLVTAIAGATLVGGGIAPIAVFAQATLEEVVVTARKRQESIQDVPVAVSAIAGDDIANAFTLDTTSLAQFAPNVVMDTVEAGTPSNGGFSIRGISYQDVEKAFDPTVLVAVDGVPLNTAVGQVFDMLDVERIEVLRGPQGTLFGKNVVGGLVNIIREKPQLNETSGKVRGRIGDYEKSQGDIVYNYGAETWAVKLTGGTSRQGEGYVTNRIASDPDKRDNMHAGAHFLWEPNDIFTGEVQFNYSDMEGNSGAWLNTSTDQRDLFCAFFGTCGGSLGDPISGDRSKIESDYVGNVELEKYQVITELNAQITDDHTLTYIGGFITADDFYGVDGDGSPLPIYHLDRWGDYQQTTHEVRLTRDASDSLTWQAGLFSSSADAEAYQITQTLLLTGSDAWSPLEDTRTSSDSHSVFAEGDYRMLDDKLVLTLGTRFITETKRMARTVTDTVTGAINVGPNAGGERKDNDWIYRWGLRYHFNDDHMVYFTNSTGFRSGGFSPRASTPDELGGGFGPETLTNFEVGLRSTFLDGRMKFNATAFHMIYEDMQVEVSLPAPNVATGNELSIRNVGEAEFDGLELELDYMITDIWRISGNAGYLDASYKKFTADIYGDGIIADETGLDLRRAPKYTASAQSTLDIAVGEGMLTWRVGYSWRDDYEATLTNHPGTTIEAHGLLDSSLSYAIGQWQFAVFGRNLTDEDNYTHDYVVSPGRPTAASANNGTLWKFALPRAPREVGAEVMYRF